MNGSVGGVGVNVGDAGGISVFVEVTCDMTVTTGMAELSNAGGGMISGVAVTMLGVKDGIGVHTGNGWGGAPQVSQAARAKVNAKSIKYLIIKILYLL